MTETRIFELLQKVTASNNENAIQFNENSRLIPEHVDVISKSIADSIYDTLKENNASSNSRRIDFIQLIRRWCNKDDNHFYVDKYNYEFLLDYYVKKNRKDVLDDKLEELYSDIENLPPSNTLEQLKRFYDERDMKMIKKRNKLDHTMELDYKRFPTNDFFVSKGIVKLEPIDNFLHNFLNNVEILNEDKSNQKITQLFDVSRIDKVKIVYALLNLSQSDNNRILLKTIVEEISAEQYKMADELELAKYLWQIEDSDRHNLNILDLFPFIYEVPIISFCKELILSCNEIEQCHLIKKFEHEHNKLIEKIRIKTDVKIRILDMIYELFILCHYNENVLKSLNIFT
ncbi:hypothetical protein QE152_g29559 [Popillia japonica]|uniref:Uncharacterized protein n=1 Tax=Popillia japonica TaxID=7064 RepID=A0AAW1JHK7_POPJA